MAFVEVVSHPKQFGSSSKSKIYRTCLLGELKVYVIVVFCQCGFIVGHKITVVVT